jgi:uncharacterized protein (TIGR03066 family)
MPAPRFTLSATFAAILIVSAGADSKAPTNKEIIVGVWELAAAPRTFPGGLPPGFSITMEFTKDGKLKTLLKDSDNNSGPLSESLEIGTYSIDGDKLTGAGKDGDKNTVTIIMLTDKKLELATIEKGKDGTTETLTFKRMVK